MSAKFGKSESIGTQEQLMPSAKGGYCSLARTSKSGVGVEQGQAAGRGGQPPPPPCLVISHPTPLLPSGKGWITVSMHKKNQDSETENNV